MARMLQIRNVPEETHRLLEGRTALEGVPMSHFVLREIERIVRRPSCRDVPKAIRSMPPVKLDRAPAEVVREARDSRAW